MTTEDSRSVVLGLLRQIAPEADLDAMDPDRDLRREIDLDSLDFQSLIEMVAASTGVEVPETDYPQVRSLSGLADYVAARLDTRA